MISHSKNLEKINNMWGLLWYLFSKQQLKLRQTRSVFAAWSGPGIQSRKSVSPLFSYFNEASLFPRLTTVIRFSLLWAFLPYIRVLLPLCVQVISAISTHTSHSASPQTYWAADWSEAKSGTSLLGDLTLFRPQAAHLHSLSPSLWLSG